MVDVHGRDASAYMVRASRSGKAGRREGSRDLTPLQNVQHHTGERNLHTPYIKNIALEVANERVRISESPSLYPVTSVS